MLQDRLISTTIFTQTPEDSSLNIAVSPLVMHSIYHGDAGPQGLINSQYVFWLVGGAFCNSSSEGPLR